MPAKKPNILVIWGDDIGMWNVGAYTHGMMGETPNIDRIAKEGCIFTDHYGQPSCTAGRAAFVMGQMPVRTGMTTIGIPGSPRGIQKEDPSIAEVLKSAGYKTGQFGKNHLGDRNDFLPTAHGFDEWFGNLYHLNAEEEPEELDYPGQKDPEYKKKYGPRGVMHAWATDKDDPTDDGVFGKRGKQKIENTGPLTRKRMETFDGEVLEHTIDWLDRNKEGPFFCWFNTTAIHIFSHSPKKYIQMAVDEGRAEEDVVRAKMLEHDEQIGVLLKWLDDNNLADDTIVIYSTDNGNEMAFWPDGGYAPFRGEKGTTWEGGVRVPMLARWPGNIPAGSNCNGLQSHEDVYVTLAAAAGLTDIKEKLLKGTKLGDSALTYKVHLDGFNQLDMWTGKSKVSARKAYFYYDETELTAVRVGNWKMHIGVKKDGSWWNAKSYPSVPYIFNLRMDPMEKMDPESEEWGYIGRKFFASKLWAPTAATPYIAEHLKSLQAYPPRQAADTLSMHKALETAMHKLENASASSN
ncbi:arylsulfatase [Sphingomonas sp. R-74633]|uniref:arylsulfatase n=1 Tax=Sphingomonas sp. R-74633 TaxID=2751188 RepID=UPI0015D1E4EC|nr:arylsulfatase [Sphingomonas sp. R-74633]NYT40946.1 arylsulfatase [Sphingomonas sp. R-74633]